MITRRELLAGSAGLAAPAVLRGATKKTNVVFIMTDDHGAWALNSYGCTDMHSPNIDRLAHEGARFTRAYACTPVCSPSRMTYMTGRLPSHHGVQDYLEPEDSFGPTSRDYLAGQPTMAETFANSGYTVGMSGKWHMGHDTQLHKGFSYWACVPGGASLYKDVVFYKNGVRTPTQGYKDDFVGDYGIEFIEKNRDQPFFLYLAFFGPHAPYSYQPDKYREFYTDSKFSCMPDDPIHPWHVRKMNGNPFFALADFNNRNSKWGYSALVSGVDANVARVVECLERLGLREDTLIVFTADQGHNCGQHGIWGKGNSTIPINMYDTSLHVPLIWNQPGRIKPGHTPDAMVSSYDLYPTMLDYLGVPDPGDKKRFGRSYAGFVRGEQPKWKNELYFEYQYVRGIRTENLKYIERTKQWPSELYDLENDPDERNNVIDNRRHAKELAALRSRLHDYFNKAGAPPIERWRTTVSGQHLSFYEGAMGRAPEEPSQ
jgi:arylsulfatase A-like enzyme